LNHTSKSYTMFKDVYYPFFDKFNNSIDTIFENMDYRPNVDKLYEEFIKSDDYQLMLEAENNLSKRYIIANWINENLFLESYFDVKHSFIMENEHLPYTIEYKLNNSIDLILQEGYKTAAGGALGILAGGSLFLASGGILWPTVGASLIALSLIAGFSDKDRENIVGSIKTAGEYLGKFLTGNFGSFLGTGTKKEVLSLIDAKDLADSIDECGKMVGWNPNESNKITRFVERIMNSNKEYDYAQCVGSKLIKFYVTTLSALYKILSASDIDDKVFDIMENGLRRGALNEMLFRNMARLSKDKNTYKLIEVINKANDAINKLIDNLSHSKDSEYARIGHNLSKILDSDLRNLAYQIQKEMRSRSPKPALNRRHDGTEIMKDRSNDRFAKEDRYSNSGRNSDNRNSYNGGRNTDNRNNSRNPF